MNKIVFKINKNYITASIYNKDIKEDLNNTNVINTKEIYFSTDYINDNLELVSSFLNVIILKHSISQLIIKDFEIILTVMDIINLLPSIKQLIIKPNKTLTYEIFLKILDNKYLTDIEAYDIPNYLLERLDLNKDLNLNLRSEILFISKFMDTNSLNTYSDIFYKKSIYVYKDFNDVDLNDFITFLSINKYLKIIEFRFFKEDLFEIIMNEVFKQNKENIKVVFDEEFLDVKVLVNSISKYKTKNAKKLEANNITFKIYYSDEYKRNNMFKQINLNVIKVTLLAIILVVTFMMSINIYRNYVDNKQSEKILNNLENIMLDIPEENNNSNNETLEYISPNGEDKEKINETTTSTYDIKYQQVFEELLKINDDTVGWLKVNNTNIDYPITKGPDNDFYLKRDFYKNKNRHGWVFVDYRNNIDTLNKNTIIYGHNLANQKMFGTLRYALNSSWYKKSSNQIITFNTINENMKWQIFSIYKVPVTTDYLITDFVNDEEYLKFIDMIKSRSIYDFNIEMNATDKILTLSTCSNGSDQRLVVHAKLIKE